MASRLDTSAHVTGNAPSAANGDIEMAQRRAESSASSMMASDRSSCHESVANYEKSAASGEPRDNYRDLSYGDDQRL